MPGTQKWKDEEIWFILRKKRQGESNATVLSSFRVAYPKHIITTTNPINYVWSHYNFISKYDEEKDSEFIAKQLAQENTRRAAIEQNQQNNGYQANAGDNVETGSGLPVNHIEAASATSLVNHALAPNLPNIFGIPLRATLNSTPPMNILNSTFVPSNIQSANSRDQSTTLQNFIPQQRTSRPNPQPSFNNHTPNTSTALPLQQSQLYPQQEFSLYTNPSFNHTHSQSNSGNIAKKQPKRPQPTSIHRSNAHFTGFRQRRASPRPARPAPPPPARRTLPVERQTQVKRVASPPVRIPQPQLSRMAPVEVAQYEGYQMTFDTNNTSGLPYAIFDSKNKQVLDREKIPSNVFRNLSTLCASHRATHKQFSLSKEEIDNQQQSSGSIGGMPYSHQAGDPAVINEGGNVQLGVSSANANGGDEQEGHQQLRQPQPASHNTQPDKDLNISQMHFNPQASGMGQPEGNEGQGVGKFGGMQNFGLAMNNFGPQPTFGQAPHAFPSGQGSFLALMPMMPPYNRYAYPNLPRSMPPAIVVPHPVSTTQLQDNSTLGMQVPDQGFSGGNMGGPTLHQAVRSTMPSSHHQQSVQAAPMGHNQVVQTVPPSLRPAMLPLIAKGIAPTESQSSSAYPDGYGPINANTHQFEAVTANQQHSIVNIVNARFVGPFTIPSPGRGWLLSNMCIVPSGAAHGQVIRGSFSLTNAGGDSTVNITGATFEQGLAMEQDDRQVGSASLPTLNSPRQPVTIGPVTNPVILVHPSASGQLSYVRPVSARGTPLALSSPTPSIKRQSKRLPTEGTPTKRQRVETRIAAESSQPASSPLLLPTPAVEYDEPSREPAPRSPGFFVPTQQPEVTALQDMPVVSRTEERAERNSLPSSASAPAPITASNLVPYTPTREEVDFDQLRAEIDARERAQAQRDVDEAKVMAEMDEYLEREGRGGGD